MLRRADPDPNRARPKEKPVSAPVVAAEAEVPAPAALVYGILADYRDGHPSILPRPPFGARPAIFIQSRSRASAPWTNAARACDDRFRVGRRRSKKPSMSGSRRSIGLHGIGRHER